AWRSIRANITRSVLTPRGVIIGVAAGVALTAVGAAGTNTITDRLTSLGTHLPTLSSRAGGGRGSRVGGASRASVPVADAEAIRDLGDPRVAGVAPLLQSGAQLKAGANNTSATVIGTWPDYATVRNSEVEEGAFFTMA